MVVVDRKLVQEMMCWKQLMDHSKPGAVYRFSKYKFEQKLSQIAKCSKIAN